METHFRTYIQSPVGIIEISGTNSFITSVLFVENEAEPSETTPEILLECKKELEEYFAGTRKQFDIKTEPEGTPFQKEVWNELKKIDYGTTCSYQAIAKNLKNPGAVRAVGLANGKNPIAIIVPCHRVIGENGKLTGYGGGLWRKQWLLEHEGNVSGKNPTLF